MKRTFTADREWQMFIVRERRARWLIATLEPEITHLKTTYRLSLYVQFRVHFFVCYSLVLIHQIDKEISARHSGRIASIIFKLFLKGFEVFVDGIS